MTCGSLHPVAGPDVSSAIHFLLQFNWSLCYEVADPEYLVIVQQVTFSFIQDLPLSETTRTKQQPPSTSLENPRLSLTPERTFVPDLAIAANVSSTSLNLTQVKTGRGDTCLSSFVTDSKLLFESACNLRMKVLENLLISSQILTLSSLKNYTNEEYSFTNAVPHDAFRITPQQGIIYVWNSTALIADPVINEPLFVKVTDVNTGEEKMDFVNVTVVPRIVHQTDQKCGEFHKWRFVPFPFLQKWRHHFWPMSCRPIFDNHFKKTFSAKLQNPNDIHSALTQNLGNHR